MLGKLARYLRILGYDAAYSREYEDSDLIRECLSGRLLITADRGLYEASLKKGCRSLLTNQGTPLPCLLALLAREGLIELEVDLKRSRCPLCNGELSPSLSVSRAGKPRVIYKCTKCGNEYWLGGHWRTIIKKLREAQECLRRSP